jgi:hypothetical protein
MLAAVEAHYDLNNKKGQAEVPDQEKVEVSLLRAEPLDFWGLRVPLWGLVNITGGAVFESHGLRGKQVQKKGHVRSWNISREGLCLREPG